MNSFLHFRISRVAIVRGLAALILLLGCGCEGPMPANILEQPAGQVSRALAAGDVLKISFPGAPELNVSPKIRLDGKVSLPLVGDVDAAGKRLEAFQQDLVARYATQLQNKEVTVGLEASAAAVYVAGAVLKPGKLLLDQPMTALEAIMEAGGITEFGSLRKVRVVRLTDGAHRTEFLNLSPAVNGQTTKAFFLKAGDMVYVPGG